MELIEAIGSGPAAVDACILIYFIEEHPRYSPILRPLFARAGSGHCRLYTSALSLLEVMIAPLRQRDNRLCEVYEKKLTRSRELQLVPIRTASLRLAAQIRARWNVRTPDALQLAAARASGCDLFLTNDRRPPALAGLNLLQLEDFA